MIVKRNSKGSPLTHAELDNNFTELETGLVQKANSTDVFTKSESNTNFAAKAGSNTQAFAVAAATTPEQAVRKSQLDATEKVHRYNNFVVSGTANDITLTLQGDRVGVTTIEDGAEVNFVASLDNTGPVIVTVDFITEQLVDIPVTKLGALPLDAGDIVQGAAYKLFWDGTGFQLFGGTEGAGTVDLSNYYTKAEVDDEMAKNRIPVGFVMTYPTLSIPTGYFKCNGQYLLIADWPSLFDVIGHTYDDEFNPNPLLYFRVPELRGEFIIGADDGRFVDSSPVKGKLINGSNIITLFDDLGNGYGIGVRISGTGIPAGATITAFNKDTGTVTISSPATITTSVAVRLKITGRVVGTSQAANVNIPLDNLYPGAESGPLNDPGYIASPKNGAEGHDIVYRLKDALGRDVIGGMNRPRNVAVCYCIKAFDTITLPAEVDWDAFVTAKTNEILDAYLDDSTADLIKIGNKLIITGTYTGPSSGGSTSAVIDFSTLATMNAGYRVFVQRHIRPALSFSIIDVPQITAKTSTSFTISSNATINNNWTYEWMVVGTGTSNIVT